MDEVTRNFKGVWIPREIYLHKGLDEFDIILLSEINSLSKTDIGCIAGNEYFGEFMRRGRTNSPKAMILMVQRSLAKMKDLGLIEIVSFNGRTRTLRTCLDPAISNLIQQPYQNQATDVSDLIPQTDQKRQGSDIKNDTHINTLNNSSINSNTNDIFSPEKDFNKWGIPDEWSSNEFREYWEKFATYWKQKKKSKITVLAQIELTKQLIEVSRGKWDTAKKIIDRTIIKGYTEFYELPKNESKQTSSPKPKTDRDYYNR